MSRELSERRVKELGVFVLHNCYSRKNSHGALLMSMTSHSPREERRFCSLQRQEERVISVPIEHLISITRVGLTFGFVPTRHLTQNGRTGGSIGILIYSYIRGGPNWHTRAQSRLRGRVATPRIWQILIALFAASGSGPYLVMEAFDCVGHSSWSTLRSQRPRRVERLPNA